MEFDDEELEESKDPNPAAMDGVNKEISTPTPNSKEYFLSTAKGYSAGRLSIYNGRMTCRTYIGSPAHMHLVNGVRAKKGKQLVYDEKTKQFHTCNSLRCSESNKKDALSRSNDIVQWTLKICGPGAEADPKADVNLKTRSNRAVASVFTHYYKATIPYTQTVRGTVARNTYVASLIPNVENLGNFIDVNGDLTARGKDVLKRNYEHAKPKAGQGSASGKKLREYSDSKLKGKSQSIALYSASKYGCSVYDDKYGACTKIYKGKNVPNTEICC